MSWEQINNAIKFTGFYRASGVGSSGLTVTVDVWNPGNTKLISDGAVTEIGGGFYEYTLASSDVSSVGEYKSVFKTSSTTVDTKHLPALMIVGRSGVEFLDLAISSVSTDVWSEAVPGTFASGTAGEVLGSLDGSVTITVANIVADDGSVTIVRGDDYNNTESRAIDFTEDSNGWPTLTNATVEMSLAKGNSTSADYSFAGSVVTATGSNKKVRFEIASSDTSLLDVGTPAYVFDVEAQSTHATPHRWTLVRGDFNVLRDYSS